MHVLDHHDRRVDHGADGDRDSSQAHDVGAHADPAHHDERDEDAERQRGDGDQRRPEVQQEQHGDPRHDQRFLEQLALQGRNRTMDQVRPIVHRHEPHAARQAALDLGDARLDRLDRLQRIAAESHHDDSADIFAPAVQIRGAAARSRA